VSRVDTPHNVDLVSDWSDFQFDWQHFLPSARALAVRVTSFTKTGGFPEYLTRTGEDTFFDITLRRCSQRWGICRLAIVEWDAPITATERAELWYSYGFGDGESGFGDSAAYEAMFFPNADAARVKEWMEGYRAGRRLRSTVEYTRRRIRRIVILLSGVPFTDSGGGQRCSQIAMAFIRQGTKVIFVNIYPSFEKEQQLFFDIDWSLLELYSLRDFSVDEVISRYGHFLDLELLVISEFPHPLLLPTIQALRAGFGRRATVIYDCIDNWNTVLGGEWYSSETEREFIGDADVLIASAGRLQDRVQQISGHPVALVANAVNDRLFDRRTYFERPHDMPVGRKVVIYVGAMWGSWFDWDLLCACMAAHVQCDFVMLGGGDEQRQVQIAEGFANAYFLGLKPQRELPRYLAYSDVAIIPFKSDDVTAYVNPLKVYEYVAMGLPVVGPDMSEIFGIPGVTVTESSDAFVAAVAGALTARPPVRDMDAFTEMNSWQRRIDEIEMAIGGVGRTGLARRLSTR
jgi:glycosyltransferase involved in cell wall biosynthesis